MIRQKGFLATLFTTVILFAVVGAIHLMRDVFVEPEINIIAPELLMVILALCMLFRVRFSRVILAVFSAVLLVYISYLALSSPSDYFLFRRIGVFMALVFASFMLWMDEALRDYTNSKQATQE